MARGVSPTVRRRELGTLLRELRHGAGLTVEDVAGQLLCSPAKISRLETGQRGAALRDVRDLCGIYGVKDQSQVDRLMNLARESKQQTWWQEYDLTGATSTLIGLEAAASSISDYQSSRLPGLLQTADYARAVLRGINPTWGAEIVEQRAEARLERQRILTRPDAPRFWA
ncbi:MAG: Scr1 family TA system antitoxin-like transcriptional regulator, partial [Dehalococcoidia bacterium]